MPETFLDAWSLSALTALHFFWKAFWAFVLGYVISACIQVFVTRERMQRTMGDAGGKSVFLGTFFGFISSSCSFAALATTKSLLKKGAGLIPSLAFLLASTNLVIELGIVIAIFLGWQFIVGEYVGGLLLIGIMCLLVKLFYPKKLLEDTRARLRDGEEDGDDEGDVPDWRKRVRSLEGWEKVGMKYVMEWKMVWKDVLIGFTIAGVISGFVPNSFFQFLFPGSEAESVTFLHTAAHSLVGPVAAFFTFIGSMGNIPLAALLFSNGVSYAGIMAFIFSDLVVFPVLRVNAKFYGWKMSLYIAAIFLAAIVGAALIMHWSLDLLQLLPEGAKKGGRQGAPEFKIGFTFWMNLVFLAITLVMAGLQWRMRRRMDHGGHGHDQGGASRIERVLGVLSVLAILWLVGGVGVRFFTG